MQNVVKWPKPSLFYRFESCGTNYSEKPKVQNESQSNFDVVSYSKQYISVLFFTLKESTNPLSSRRGHQDLFFKKGVPHLFSKFLKNTHLEINFFKLLSYSLENWKFFFLEFFKDFDYKFKFRTAISQDNFLWITQFLQNISRWLRCFKWSWLLQLSYNLLHYQEINCKRILKMIAEKGSQKLFYIVFSNFLQSYTFKLVVLKE